MGDSHGIAQAVDVAVGPQDNGRLDPLTVEISEHLLDRINGAEVVTDTPRQPIGSKRHDCTVAPVTERNHALSGPTRPLMDGPAVTSLAAELRGA